LTARIERALSHRARSASKEACPFVPSPTDPLQNLPIRLFNLPQILPKPILIHRFLCGQIPEAAGVRRNLIGQNQLTVVQAKLQLEINEDHLSLTEKWLQEAIHFQRQPFDLRHVLRRRQLHQSNMLIGNQGIAQRIVLVVPLHHSRLDRIALFQTQPLRQAACDDITDHHFDRHNRHFLREQLPIAKTLDCIGLFCPEPLFQTREAIDSLEPGEILEVLADDPAAEEDLARFAKRTGHEVVDFEESDDSMRFLIRKGK